MLGLFNLFYAEGVFMLSQSRSSRSERSLVSPHLWSKALLDLSSLSNLEAPLETPDYHEVGQVEKSESDCVANEKTFHSHIFLECENHRGGETDQPQADG